MSIPLKLITPPGSQRYDCTGCGDCCRGRFAIVITQADRDRIVGQGWTDEELGLHGKPIFTSSGADFQLAHRADGTCVFLTDDNRCRIHARHGEAAKPLACRLYPFTFVPLGKEVRVDVRFDCPATATSRGRPLAAHRPDLLELVKTAVPAQAAALPVPPLYDDVRLSWAQLGRITEAFEQVLLDVSLDITRRVAACIALADGLRHPGLGEMDGRKLRDFLDAAASEVQQSAVDDLLRRKPPLATERMALRQLAGLYGRLDHVGGKAQLGQRLNVSLRMLAGKGRVPAVRPGFPSVTFAELEMARGIPTEDAAQALERYLHVHLAGMGFFGRAFYGRSYLDGLNALLLTYPLVCWFARAFAASENRPALDAACVERALMIVDHQHGITPLLDIPSERYRTRFLCEPGTLRSLTIWYGS
ncbi:MAG: YkgJ family cysteine cluster protein [Armatimonadota bacterium]|nr:YkgJ family cysteine cluster protein [Armatimonadota bacterium]